ncbi:MAG: FAD:protein FMN transferase [Pseudomonadales bacterium]
MAVFFVLAGCDTPPKAKTFSGQVMGTSYSVQLIELPAQLSEVDLDANIATTLNSVDAAMSTYKPESEVSRFNRAPPRTSVEVSAATLQVVELALVVHKQSQGAFDISVAPLVDLWGFGADMRELKKLPDEDAIKRAREKVGGDAINVQKAPPTLSKGKDLAIDLSAIAKGYAVDRVAELLEKQGITNYLVEVGGELRGRGQNAKGQTWRIGIETPMLARGNAFTSIPLDDMAVATSGDYRNYIVLDGKRYSHTIDPRTGMPVAHQVASVTVVHASAAEADAWATALDVLGVPDGLRLAEQLGLAAYFIVRDGEKFNGRETTAFSAYNNN